jgi:hypothetical protein
LPLGENIHVINDIINLNKITKPIITINKNANFATQLFDSRKSVEPLTIFFDEKSLNDAVALAPAPEFVAPVPAPSPLSPGGSVFAFAFDVSAIII